MSPVTRGGPHASAAHRAVAAALAVAVGAFQGQLHATVLLKRQSDSDTRGRLGDTRLRARETARPTPASSVLGQQA